MRLAGFRQGLRFFPHDPRQEAAACDGVGEQVRDHDEPQVATEGRRHHCEARRGRYRQGRPEGLARAGHEGLAGSVADRAPPQQPRAERQRDLLRVRHAAAEGSRRRVQGRDLPGAAGARPRGAALARAQRSQDQVLRVLLGVRARRGLGQEGLGAFDGHCKCPHHGDAAASAGQPPGRVGGVLAELLGDGGPGAGLLQAAAPEHHGAREALGDVGEDTTGGQRGRSQHGVGVARDVRGEEAQVACQERPHLRSIGDRVLHGLDVGG
mmetsp:Transcript_98839/g.285285  ORF Transcript_98839/g.285285 Transcript_98839/m.285285 type:complete len:267 (-) Transcript_98839:836-1636(-)